MLAMISFGSDQRLSKESLDAFEKSLADQVNDEMNKIVTFKEETN